MRAALNIVFGILLLVMQTMASVAPHTVGKATGCQCCSCGSKACPTSQTTPAPAPSPLASQLQVSNETEKASLPAPRPTLGLASREINLPRPLTDSASRPTGQPLYERFCALLI